MAVHTVHKHMYSFLQTCHRVSSSPFFPSLTFLLRCCFALYHPLRQHVFYLLASTQIHRMPRGENLWPGYCVDHLYWTTWCRIGSDAVINEYEAGRFFSFYSTLFVSCLLQSLILFLSFLSLCRFLSIPCMQFFPATVTSTFICKTIDLGLHPVDYWTVG